MSKISGVLILIDSELLSININSKAFGQDEIKKQLEEYSNTLSEITNTLIKLRENGAKPRMNFVQWLLGRNSYIGKCDLLLKRYKEIAKDSLEAYGGCDENKAHWHFHLLLEAIQSLRAELFYSLDDFYNPNKKYGSIYQISLLLEEYPIK